jgi:branched-subunit amino acid transport protein
VSTWEQVLAIIGLGLVSLLTRSALLLSRRELPMPAWLQRGLKYAPLAALAGIVVPQIAMTDGHLIDTLKDARIYAMLAGGAWYWWRRELVGVIICGMLVLVPLKLLLGW